MGISFLMRCRSMHKHQGLSIYPTSFQWGFQWDLKTTTIVGASFCRTISSVIGFSMVLSGWIGIHQYTHQPDIFCHGGGSAIIPITGDMAIFFFITLLSCRRLEWISLFLATSFYHMNPEPTSMEPQNAQCGRSSRSSPRDPRGSGAWNHRSCQKPCQAPAGRCDIEKLTAGYGSKFIGPQQFSIKLSILRGDNFEPYPHGFLVDNMGLGGCVLIQELCVRG